MEITTLKTLRLVQFGRTLLKVSTNHGTYLTAQVLLDGGSLPWRTIVRSYTPAQVAKFREPTAHILNRYEDLTGRPAYCK